jgi:seryl-tRNA synthetase
MIDLKLLRADPDVFRRAIQVKRISLDLDALLALDAEVRARRHAIEQLEATRNAQARRVRDATAAERPALIAEGRALGVELEGARPALREAEARLHELLLLVPMPPAPEAPIGASDAENVEQRRWGTPPRFAFEPLDHVRLLERNGWAELRRAAELAGARSWALRGEMVLLELALLRFALEHLAARGFVPLEVPAMAREAAFIGTGHFPSGRDETYALDDELYLVGTAEVAVNALHAGEMLSDDELPLRYAALSTCFRREAGSAGRDTRGLFRVHQFTKVEQYVLCRADPVESQARFEELLQNAEEILQALEIPYRVMEVCTGDMGPGKVRQVDLEAWFPSERRYRETHSCSSLFDWQARRTNLRYRDRQGRLHFAHTLNNTGLATPRILAPLLENHQREDGSIQVPGALRPFLGGKERLTQH